MSPNTPQGSSLGGLEDVREIIAIASGKGGVGKSTTSVNLAIALQKSGHRVGIADCDIYGPSIPSMVGITHQPDLTEDKQLIPIKAYEISTISMGYLLEKQDLPVVWRGPMLHKMIQQFLFGVQWGELDYLILDLPPGTGDIQLTLTQSVPLTGAIIVTTPQEISIIDAKKALTMFRQAGIRVLGIIENMSSFECPHCGKEKPLFKSGGGKKLAESLKIHFLGALPLEVELAKNVDTGIPFTVSHPDHSSAKKYIEIGKEIAGILG